LKFLGEV
jgi:hypothetical protein